MTGPRWSTVEPRGEEFRVEPVEPRSIIAENFRDELRAAGGVVGAKDYHPHPTHGVGR